MYWQWLINRLLLNKSDDNRLEGFILSSINCDRVDWVTGYEYLSTLVMYMGSNSMTEKFFFVTIKWHSTIPIMPAMVKAYVSINYNFLEN